jgi:hypothetical protein
MMEWCEGWGRGRREMLAGVWLLYLNKNSLINLGVDGRIVLK